jgi:hypothetical protein
MVEPASVFAFYKSLLGFLDHNHFHAFCLQTALHGSCPVIKGEKWVATKWIRDKPVSAR